MNKRLIKTKILLEQNQTGFIVIIIWFLINFIVFYFQTEGDFLEALSIIFYFQQAFGSYGNFYYTISELVIFGIILSVVVTGFYRKYSPIQTSLAIARKMSDHTVIIGYSHFGIQIRNYLLKNKRGCVVIEPDEKLVQELIDDECPVVLRAGNNIEALKDAKVEDAKLIITTKNDLETLFGAIGLIRSLNKKCRIICRCFDDSIAKILENTYQCHAISTSKYAADLILKEIQTLVIKKAIIIGYTNICKRLTEPLKTQGVKYTIIEKVRSKIEDIIDEEPVIIGDAKDQDNLKKAGITDCDIVIILIDDANENLIIADKIRDLNKNCKLICRFFHEDVGEILGKTPFNAKIISQSKYALDMLVKEGLLDYK